MTDIYPQSPEDSHAVLSEMHPLSQKLKALEEKCRALEENREALKGSLEAANMIADECNEALLREEARHKITQNNLRQAQHQCDHLTKTIQAIHAVMMIGEAPF